MRPNSRCSRRAALTRLADLARHRRRSRLSDRALGGPGIGDETMKLSMLSVQLVTIPFLACISGDVGWATTTPFGTDPSAHSRRSSGTPLLQSAIGPCAI